MTRRIHWIISIVFVHSLSALSAQNQEQLLHNNWKFRHLYGGDWMQATVPGTVHTDLLKNNKIPDPFMETNERFVQWVDTCTWEYQATFVISEKESKYKSFLRFNGLDTYADVYLNNVLVLQADNMFRNWDVSTSEKLKTGVNSLRVVFHPVHKIEASKAATLPYTLPDNSRVFTRKAAYQYGWDWGPRLLTAGIWRPVSLVIQNGSFEVKEVHVKQQEITDQLATVNVISKIQSDLQQSIKITVWDEGNNQLLNSVIYSVQENLVQEWNVKVTIKNPKRWWCNGTGEPYLYTIRVEIESDKNERHIERRKIGLRTIELIQQSDSIGKSFYFKLNGRPVFAKGANVIPLDNFLPRVSALQYQNLVEEAKASNMNMLRIWGGGVYADDAFMNACDEHGIMVWHDFMFANSMYPSDTAFLESVKQEVSQQVKRLRDHPSLVLWCGNNEISEGWFNWGWQNQFKLNSVDSANIWNGYKNIFERVIPEAVREADSDALYWSTSPMHGWGRKESLKEGDLHYWGVWWGKQPFEVYEQKVGRFMSEYGFQGMPSVETFKRFTNDSLSLEAPAVKAHQKHPTGYETIEHYRSQWFDAPFSFEDYVYQSQLLQAEGMKIGIEAHRRAMPDCMGTLYWQLNDCWPVTSWSSMDYYGVKKASHYFIKKAFQKNLVSVVSHKGKYELYFVSDDSSSRNLNLKLQIMDFSGNILWKNQYNFKSKIGSQRIALLDSLELAAASNASESMMVAFVQNGDKEVARNYYYFERPINLALIKPSVSIEAVGKNGIKIVSGTFVKNLYLQAENVQFSDNYFDVLPNEPVYIQVLSVKPIRKVINSITLKSVYESTQ